MMKQNEYRAYIDEHKANIEICFNKYKEQLCAKLDIDLYVLSDLIDVHDLSKYEEPEFSTYGQYFFPYKDKEKDKALFDIGWLHHQNSNPHHPEFWMLRDNRGVTTLDMPAEYVAEMLLDWAAMGMKFNDTAYSYYKKSGAEKPFSENTRKLVESVIEIFK